MENTNINSFILISASEARQLEEKDGFFTNSIPIVDDDQIIRRYCVDKAWYDYINYQDYISNVAQ